MTVARDPEFADWLLDRTGFESPSPFNSHSFCNLVGIVILRKENRVTEKRFHELSGSPHVAPTPRT
jgi:hypothetical protein